jgi:periplasmic divalent cation tolerance protein
MTNKQTEYVVVWITAANEKEANDIASSLIEDKLAACVNIIKGVQSLFWWDGKVDNAQEVLLTAKTSQERFDQLARRVKELHSYDVPEIIALPIVKGSEDYLKWIGESAA